MQAKCVSSAYTSCNVVSSVSHGIYIPNAMATDWRFANYLAQRLHAGAWDISELARRTKSTRPSVYRWLRGGKPPAIEKRRDMFDSFGFKTVDEFDTAWLAMPRNATAGLQDLNSRTAVDAASESQPSGNPGQLDNNVGRIPANPLPIPEWSAEIACGHWIDCSTAALDPDTQMAIIRAVRFRVRVMGDSMLPKYKPGACVQFRIVRMDEEALQIGAHYYVQNSAGQCTLKVLKAIEEDEYVLAPTNRKYKPLRIAKQMVARWAIVETIVVAPWEE